MLDTSLIKVLFNFFFPLDCIPFLSDRIGSVWPYLFFPGTIVLWGWPWVANCLQRDPCIYRCFSLLLSGEGFLSKHLVRNVWLVFRQRDKSTCLLVTKLGFFLWGLHRPIGGKDTIACSTWRIISRGFFSEWDMVMAKGLVQWHLILSRGRRW